ncbi:MAG: SEL1-like repeat protein [Alphaproteobacteria bacterium]
MYILILAVAILALDFQAFADQKSENSSAGTKPEVVNSIRAEAEAGKADAQYYIGCMYRDGRGVAKDLEVAKQWFFKAGKQKHQKGQIAFNHLYNEIELQKPGVSNIVRPVDVVQQGIIYLALDHAGFKQSLDDIKAPPFHFGLPYKTDDSAAGLFKGLGTARNPDMLWLYNPDGDEEFVKFKSEIIAELVKDDFPKIVKELKAAKDSKPVFYEKFVEHLKKVGIKRGEIAKKLKSDKAEEFGVWRATVPSPHDDLHTTLSPEDPVGGRYQPWARHTKETVYKLAKVLLENPGMDVTPWVEYNDPANSIRTRVKLSLFLKQDYLIIRKHHVTKLQEACVNHWPQHYTNFFEPAAFAADDGVRFLVLTMEIGEKDNFLPATRISGLFKPDKEKPNGFSQKALASFLASPLIAAHLDSKNIEPLLEMCSAVWYQALTWDGKDIKELINAAAKLQYCLDSASPFKRGSGWIAEVIVEALFNFHGYDVFLAPGTISMVQVALGVPMDEFLTLYPQMVKVRRQ